MTPQSTVETEAARPSPWAWALLATSSLFALTAAVLLGVTPFG